MQEPPRNPAEPIINRDMLINIAVQSIVMTGAVLGAFFYAWKAYGIEMGRTYALTALIISELLRAYTCRSEKYTVVKLGIFSNKNMNLASIVSFGLLAVILLIPGLRDVFNVSTLHMHDVDFILIVGALPLLFGELTKMIKAAVRRRN